MTSRLDLRVRLIGNLLRCILLAVMCGIRAGGMHVLGWIRGSIRYATGSNYHQREQENIDFFSINYYVCEC